MASKDVLMDRIPFGEVIGDKKFMKGLWEQLSLAQQVVLKAFYGLPLVSDAEKAIWAVFNENCTYDELGYPTSIIATPYKPKEYSRLVGRLGRRSGKSTEITAIAVLYEIIFGGHKQYVKDWQTPIVPYIATDLPTAKENMMAIKNKALEVPLLASQILDGPKDEINFKNGFRVEANAMSVKSGRGWAMPVVVFDEVGFWRTKTEAVNQDVEVERAIRPAQTQFQPFAKQFLISTPYVEEGLLWEYSKAGTDGKWHDQSDPEGKARYEDVLVIWAPTAAMGNPVMNTIIKTGKPTKVKFELERKADPEAYEREFIAKFTKAIGGLIPKELIDAATDKGVKERKREAVEKEGLVPFYVASMDPAFKHDSWAFTIGHRDNKGVVVQDVLRVWEPQQEINKELNPDVVLDEIAALCKQWNVSHIVSDQYHLQTLQQLGLQKGLAIMGNIMTANSKKGIYGNLLQLLRSNSIRLLDEPIIYNQLGMLQRRYTALNQVQISAPPGRHDDVATAVALLADAAVQLYPTIKREVKPPTRLEQAIAKRQQIDREMALEEEW